MPVEDKIQDQPRLTEYDPIVASVGPFDVNFPVFGSDDLEVFLDEVATTAFTFAGTFANGVSLDATITLDVAFAGHIDILGSRNPSRPDQYTQGKGVPASTHNLSLNVLTATLREVFDKHGRGVFGPISETGPLILPRPADRAGKLFGFGTSGEAEAVSGTLFGAPGPAGDAIFFDTKAAVEGTAIDGSVNFLFAGGRSAVGDGGDALFRRVGAEPAHPGKIQSTDGAWWEIVPKNGVLNIKALGAVGDGVVDDAPAIGDAIDVIAAGVGSTLFFPTGNFLFNSRISRGALNVPLTIRGAGLGNTFLLGNNVNGLLSLTWTFIGGPAPQDVRQVLISDLTCIALLDGSGTAFDLNFPNYVNLHLQSLTVMRVNILPAASDSSEYWNNGILTDNAWRAYFEEVNVGPSWGASATNIQSPTVGIQLKGHCFTPSFYKCAVWGGVTGYRIGVGEADDDGEGAAFIDCRAVECQTGILLDTPGLQPEFQIIGGHYNCTRINLHIKNRNKGLITGALLFADVTAGDVVATFRDILLEGCSDVLIDGNTAVNNAGPAATKISIEVKNEAVSLFESLRNVLRGNLIQDRDTGILITGAGTNNTHIQGNRMREATVTTQITDGGSNTVVHHEDRRRALVALSANQSIPDNTATAIAWATETYEHGGDWFENIINPSRLTVPSGKGIKAVRLQCNVLWPSNNVGIRRLEIRKNGATVSGGAAVQFPAGAGQEGLNAATATLQVSEGDYFEVLVTQNSGAALDVLASNSTWFSIEAMT